MKTHRPAVAFPKMRRAAGVARPPLRPEMSPTAQRTDFLSRRVLKSSKPVVIARRPADKHILQHQFDRARRTAVADKVGAKLSARRTCQMACCRAGFSLLFRSPRSLSAHCATRLASRNRPAQYLKASGPADNSFLRLSGQRVPSLHIVKILLHNHVAARRRTLHLRRRSTPRLTASSPRGFSVPSTKPIKSRSSK